MGFFESSPIKPEQIVCCANRGCRTELKAKNAIMIFDPENESAIFFCSKKCRHEYTNTGQNIFEGAP